jgi:hypothetical protein
MFRRTITPLSELRNRKPAPPPRLQNSVAVSSIRPASRRQTTITTVQLRGGTETGTGSERKRNKQHARNSVGSACRQRERENSRRQTAAKIQQNKAKVWNVGANTNRHPQNRFTSNSRIPLYSARRYPPHQRKQNWCHPTVKPMPNE